MNLKLIIIACFVVFFSITAFGQYNYTQKLGSFATIALPNKPKIQNLKEIDFYTSNYNNVLFFAQIGGINGGLRDIFSGNNIGSVYSSYVKGVLTGTKGKLFYNDKIKINGHNGIKFGYEAELKGQRTYRYQYTIDIKDTILTCGIVSSDSLSKDDQHLKAFFDGFKVKNAEQLSKEHNVELGYKTGKIIAILTMLCIPVLIGLGIVFLIKKLAYRKSKDKSTSA